MDKPQKLDKRYYRLQDIQALLDAKHAPGTYELEVGFILSSTCTLAVALSQDANSPPGKRRLYPFGGGTDTTNGRERTFITTRLRYAEFL